MLAPPFTEYSKVLVAAEGSTARMERMTLDTGRHVEQCHDCIANVLVNEPVLFLQTGKFTAVSQVQVC